MYNSTSRTNFFRVVDVAAFRDAMAAFPVVIHDGAGDDAGLLMLEGADDEGCFPCEEMNEDLDEFEPLDFPGVVAEHLVEGEILVMVSVGADKLRYLGAQAVAINRAGERVVLQLSDILTLAATQFGREPRPYFC